MREQDVCGPVDVLGMLHSYPDTRVSCQQRNRLADWTWGRGWACHAHGFGGCLYTLPWSGYLTSAQVLGNGTGMVAVIASVLWFQNPVSVYGLAGYGVTFCGVIAYSQVHVGQATIWLTSAQRLGWQMDHLQADDGNAVPVTHLRTDFVLGMSMP